MASTGNFCISSGRGILVHSNYVASCCCRKILHRCWKCRFRYGSDIIIKYFKQITHCDIMTPFSDLDLCQNGLGWWLFASIIKSSLEITYPDNNAHCSCFVVCSWNGYGPFFFLDYLIGTWHGQANTRPSAKHSCRTAEYVMCMTIQGNIFNHNKTINIFYGIPSNVYTHEVI